MMWCSGEPAAPYRRRGDGQVLEDDDVLLDELVLAGVVLDGVVLDPVSLDEVLLELVSVDFGVPEPLPVELRASVL